jgi:hypothetical protein
MADKIAGIDENKNGSAHRFGSNLLVEVELGRTVVLPCEPF